MSEFEIGNALTEALGNSLQVEDEMSARGYQVAGVVIAVVFRDQDNKCAFFSDRANLDDDQALEVLYMLEETIIEDD